MPASPADADAGAAGLGCTPGGVRLKGPLKPPDGGPDLLNDFLFLPNSELTVFSVRGFTY